jgi:D-amino-acid dehydrogenase
MPGLFFKSIKWLFDPLSPLHIKPEPSLLLISWLYHFMRSMNEKKMKESIQALTELSIFSLQAYQELDKLFLHATSFEQKGLLMVGQTAAGVKSAVEEMKLVAEHGIPGQQLSSDEIHKLEPAITGKIEGGVFFPKEAHAEPLAVVQTLEKASLQNKVDFFPNTEAYFFETQNQVITEVRTTRGTLKAKQVILATGLWSTIIAKQIGLNVPIMAGKGYSMIVKPFAPAPHLPLMLVEKKIAVTPRANTIRIAGTLELVRNDDSINNRRVQAILKGSREFMNVPENPEIIETWRGLRPCTPDGVPLIGRSHKHRNLVISAGHQMLGLQTGIGSGKLTAEIALNQKPSFDPRPFRIDRF